MLSYISLKVYTNFGTLPIYRPLTATPFKRNGFYTENPSSKELQSYIRCYWGTEKPLIQIENDDAPELVIRIPVWTLFII